MNINNSYLQVPIPVPRRVRGQLEGEEDFNSNCGWSSWFGSRRGEQSVSSSARPTGGSWESRVNRVQLPKTVFLWRDDFRFKLWRWEWGESLEQELEIDEITTALDYVLWARRVKVDPFVTSAAFEYRHLKSQENRQLVFGLEHLFWKQSMRKRLVLKQGR